MLSYLLDPAFQIVNTAGRPLTGGAYIEVYIAGSRDKYYCYSDFNGTLHPFQIPLDSLGSNVVLADTTHSYDVYVYNRYGSLLMSRYNVHPGQGSGGGGGTITSSDGSIDVTPTPSGYDLKVNGQDASVLRAGATDLTEDGQFVFSELVRDGDHVYVDNNGKIRMEDGWFHYDITARVKWEDASLSNTESHVQLYTTLNSDIIPFDCTYEHEDTLHLHGELKNTTGGSQFVVGVQGIPSGMVVELVDCGIFAITGHGSSAEYEAGEGIVIDDHEISIDPSVVQEKLTPGDYVEITEQNVINVTGLQPSGDYLPESASSQFMPITASGGLFTGVETDTSLTGVGISGNELGLNTAILTGYQPSGDYVYNSSFTSYTANIDSSITTINNNITSIQNDITNIESSISGLTGTYVEQSSFTGYTASAETSFVHTGDMTAYQPSGNYQTAGDYVSSSDLSAYQLTADMTGYLPESASSEFMPATATGLFTGVETDSTLTGNGLSGSALGVVKRELEFDSPLQTALSGDTAHVSLDTAFLSDYQPTSAMSAYATTGDLSSKLDATASSLFQPTSSMSAYQLTADMTGYLPESASSEFMPSSATGLFTGVVTDSSLSGNGLSSSPLGVSSTELVFNAPLSTSVSGDTAYVDLDTGFVSSFQPTSAMSDYQTTAGMSAYATTGDLADYQPTSSMSSYQTTADMSAYQPSGNYQTAGDYVSSSDLADYQTTAGMSAYQPSGNYQTAGDYVSSSDLADYQTTAGMSAYQPSGNYQTAGDYVSSSDLADYQPTSSMSAYQLTADMSGYLPESASSQFMPATANPFTGVATDLTLTGNGLSGSALGVNKRELEFDSPLQTSLSGDTAHVSLDTAFMSGYQPTSAMSAYQPSGNYQTAGDYVSSSELANYQETSGMSAYQETSGMSAYLPYSAINIVEV